jgi:serine/threonine-protein kinase RsbW
MAGELAGNAVQHSKSRGLGRTFTVRVLVCYGELVRVEVADAGGTWAEQPRERGCDGDGPGGRGLSIVQALAAAWGVTGGETGRTVWFNVGWSLQRATVT